MNLLDTLMPANPPAPKNAKLVPLFSGGEGNDSPTSRADMNQRAASVRALLADHPEGMGYDELSKRTGIPRDKIGKPVGDLLVARDIKRFVIDGRGEIFRFSGDQQTIGTRRQEQQPAPKPTVPQKESKLDGIPLSSLGKPAAPKPATPPAPTSAPSKDAEPVRVADQKAVAPQVPPVVRPPVDAEGSTPHASSAKPAAAAAPVPPHECYAIDIGDAMCDVCGKPLPVPAAAHDQQAEGARASGSASSGTAALPTAFARSASPSGPAEPKRRAQLDLMTELTIVAAANLAAAVRGERFVEFTAAVNAALRTFERADRLREEMKAERA